MKNAMKYLFILLCSSATAQHLEFGLNAGVFPYKISQYLGQYTPSIQPMTSLKTMYRMQHYEVGIDAGYRLISSRAYIPSGNAIEYFSPNGFLVPFKPPTYHTLTDEIPVKVIANRTFSIKRLSIYGGLFAGYMWYNRRAIHELGDTYPSVSGSYFFAGAQAGTSWAVSNRLAINMEFGWECSDFHFHYLQYMPNTMLYPMSAGIRYRIAKRTNNH